ncbi:MAG: hypothetical protein AB1798_23210 [Spirochaetota bacterium]
MVAYETQLAHFFRDTIKVPRIFASFHDIRMHPRIRLREILVSLFLMPYWGMKALLQLDIFLRTPPLLRLFRCRHKKVVVSDTTIARVLTWLDPQDSRKALLAPLATLNKEGLLQLKLAPTEPCRRIGVIDGSQMGHHYLVAALLCGKMNYPVMIEPCSGRGHELTVAQALLSAAQQKLGSAAPRLWLFDALYFNQTTFNIVRQHQAHLLIKYSPRVDEATTKLFRDVLEDTKRLFAARTQAIDPVAAQQGFDSNRCCSWSMKKTSAEFAGYPVHIFLLSEDYSKRRKNAHTETWITTTDLSLTFEEAREAAHLHWQIENNEFKRLSHHAGTKTVYFKDPRPFFSLLRLFCLALTVFDAFFSILHRNEALSKSLMQGCKVTWESAFSQMWWHYQAAFVYLVTAGI